MACPLPTVNIPLAELGMIFEKMTTIAIVGLSPESSKDSYRVASYLQAQGYRIVPIYPKEDTILGEVVYRSLGDIPFDIDSVVIFRKPDAVMAIAQEILSRHDISIVWLQLGIVNDEAAMILQESGRRVVQNRCIMVEHRRNKGVM